MERTILVAGQQGILDAAIARAAHGRGHRVTFARDPQGEGGEAVAGLGVVRWNPPSPLSARAALLECGEGPDAVIVALERFGFPGEFHLAGAAEIDAALDGSLRGLFQLAREAVARFARRSSGCLIVALREGAAAGPIAVALATAAKEFTLALAEGAGAGLRVHGISCDPGQEDALAEQALEYAEAEGDRRPQARWLKVGTRSFPWSR